MIELFTRTTPVSTQSADPAVLALACARYLGVELGAGRLAGNIAAAAEGVNYNSTSIIVVGQGIGDTLRFLFSDDFDFAYRDDTARPYLLYRLFDRALGLWAGRSQINIRTLEHTTNALHFECTVTSVDRITDLIRILISSDGVWKIVFHTLGSDHSCATFSGRRSKVSELLVAGRASDLCERLREFYSLKVLSERIQA